MRYDYELINERNHPIIKGTIVGPSRNEELIMMVDTGFEGFLLIPSELYNKLGFLKREHPISESF